MDGIKTEWGNGWNGNPFPLSEQGVTGKKTEPRMDQCKILFHVKKT